jgi:branched-chain amino acid transport system ATP-binding protein
VGRAPGPDPGPGAAAALPEPVGCGQHRARLLQLDPQRQEAPRSDAYGRALDLFPDLRPHLRQAAGTLSGGEQQMVAIARGLASGPKILAVDEPCLGLAEAVSRRVYEALSRVHQAGTTLIVVEEAPKRALQICDRRVEVRNGVVLPGGPGAAPRAGGPPA